MKRCETCPHYYGKMCEQWEHYTRVNPPIYVMSRWSRHVQEALLALNQPGTALTDSEITEQLMVRGEEECKKKTLTTAVVYGLYFLC